MIFISYAHVDAFLVKTQVFKPLTSKHFAVWFDENLIPGKDFEDQLENAIRQCDVVIFAATPEASSSKWCLWELEKAQQYNKPIIPVLLQPRTKLPASISKLQYVDFTNGAKKRLWHSLSTR